MTSKRKILFCLTLLAIVALAYTPSAQAQCGYSHGGGYGRSYGGYGYSYGGYGYRTPIYHRPSVHLDRVYHVESLHWTPYRGLHAHGHYDLIPHYTPGHFDRLHGGHIHYNRRFHH